MDSIFPTPLIQQAEKVVRILQEKDLTIATAESCTGGLIAAAITSISGASGVFHCGFVTYSNDIKQKMLGVSSETICQFSAVSEETAAEMSYGARQNSGADIAVSVTGNAGPDPSECKPVGLVFISISSKKINETTVLHFGNLSRNEIRLCTAEKALELIYETVKKMECENI